MYRTLSIWDITQEAKKSKGELNVENAYGSAPYELLFKGYGIFLHSRVEKVRKISTHVTDNNWTTHYFYRQLCKLWNFATLSTLSSRLATTRSEYTSHAVHVVFDTQPATLRFSTVRNFFFCKLRISKLKLTFFSGNAKIRTNDEFKQEYFDHYFKDLGLTV